MFMDAEKGASGIAPFSHSQAGDDYFFLSNHLQRKQTIISAVTEMTTVTMKLSMDVHLLVHRTGSIRHSNIINKEADHVNTSKSVKKLKKVSTGLNADHE